MKKNNLEDSFYKLDPQFVMNASESAGFLVTGEFSQLNSYENRVFDIQVIREKAQAHFQNEDTDRIIAKFYRPNRWSADSIIEEHNFLKELQSEGLQVAAPIKLKNANYSDTILKIENMYVGFFPKIRGRLPQEFFKSDFSLLGKKLAILHNIGSRKQFLHRPIMAEYPQTPYETLAYLLPHVCPELRFRYEQVSNKLFDLLRDLINPEEFQRIHGDFHRGNVLHNGLIAAHSDFYLVDFDDCMMGPIVQDFWMLFSSEKPSEDEMLIIDGYEEFREFPHHQLEWIPLLRALRILNYAAWIARRWSDPSFPKIFTEFGSFSYWAEETEALEKIVWNFPS